MPDFDSSDINSIKGLHCSSLPPDAIIPQEQRPDQKLTSFEFYSTLDTVNEAILIINTDYKIRFTNKTLCKLFNVKDDELSGKYCWEVLECPFYNSPKCNLMKVAKGKKPKPFEIERPNKSNIPTPYLLSVHPLYSKNGQLLGLIESFKDISRRKRLQFQLNEAQELYRSIVELSSEIGEAIILVQDSYDFEGVIVFASKQFSRITGYTQEELVGKPYFELIAEQDRLSSLERHRRKMGGEILPGLYEIRLVHKDGKHIPVELTSATNQYKGRAANVIYLRDITERNKMEQALIKERDLSRKYLDTANVIIVAINIEGIVTLINTKGCQILEGKQSDILGKNWVNSFIPLEYRAGVGALVDKIFTGELPQAEYNENPVITLKGKKRIIAWHNSVITDEENNIIGVLGSGEDVTELRRAEIHLKKYHQKLEKLVEKRTASLNEQIERRIEFTRALVHELKTPLTAILSSSEVLSEKITERSLLPFINNINKSGLALDQRVDELLDMAKSEIGVLSISSKIINPLTLLKQIVEEMTPAVNKKGQTIIFEGSTVLPYILGDPDRLNQVLLNLISNAIKFNRKGGQITISALQRDSHIVFQVGDQGSGITAGEQERIFLPYYRLRRDRERFNGLGLGLALSKSLVELHGGNMWVENNTSCGCTFYFSIPVEKSRHNIRVKCE